jgi:hypothetical protein
VSAISLSSSTLDCGDSFSARVTVRNSGSAAASSSSTLDLWMSTDTVLDGSDVWLGSDTVAALAAGATASSTLSSLVVPDLGSSGSYLYVLAVADADGDVAESNESDNGSYDWIYLSSACLDIDLYGDSLSLDDTCAHCGDYVDASLEVGNQGADDAWGSGYVDWYLSTDSSLDSGDTYIDTDSFYSVYAGSTSSVSGYYLSVPSSASGSYTLLADIDSDDDFAETDESNNTVASSNTLTVHCTSSSVDYDAGTPYLSSSWVSVGDTWSSIEVSVSNWSSSAASASSQVDFYISSDSTLDSGDTLLGSDTIAAVGSWDSETAELTGETVPSLASGYWYLVAEVDSGNAVSESDECSNNTSSTSFYVY